MSNQGSAALAVVCEEGEESLSLENETPTPLPPRGLIEGMAGGVNEPPPISTRSPLSTQSPISALLSLPKFLLVRLPSAESVRICMNAN